MISRALAPGSGEKFSDIRGAPVTNTSRPRVTAPRGAVYWFFQNPPRDSTRRRAVSDVDRPASSVEEGADRGPFGRRRGRQQAVDGLRERGDGVDDLGRARGHRRDRHAPAVRRVGRAGDVARAFETVDDAGDGAAGDPGELGQAARRQAGRRR